jgi:hypothetical protein
MINKLQQTPISFWVLVAFNVRVGLEGEGCVQGRAPEAQQWQYIFEEKETIVAAFHMDLWCLMYIAVVVFHMD